MIIDSVILAQKFHKALIAVEGIWMMAPLQSGINHSLRRTFTEGIARSMNQK